MRLFVLLSRFPYPLERGDKLRAFHQLRILSREHEVFLCALHEDELKPEWHDAVRPFCKELKTFRLNRSGQLAQLAKCAFGSRPFQVGYFFNSSIKKEVEQLVAAWRPDAIYCQLLRTAPYMKDIHGIPKVIDFQDAFAKGIERRLETDPWYLQPILHSEKKRLERYEPQVFAQFDAVTIISEQDRDQLSFAERDRVRVVRNGVQMERFSPSDAPKTEDVLFAGNMGYPPNIEAGLLLANGVMPLVWNGLPSARLMLAGARPSYHVRQLENDRITVTGWVDDMRDCYARARVFVAPMFIGTGLQNKLLEAMAMRLPCITTPLANNALGAEPGREVLIAETEQEFASAILLLLNDADRAKELAENGHRFIGERFGWEAQTEPLLRVLEEVVGRG
ncbi:MAG: glycosyltransferase [Flavobacteriales bacterium]|nr:glycosyltransferase [Flavobacteriales bacterium]